MNARHVRTRVSNENLMKNAVYLNFDMQQIYCIMFPPLCAYFSKVKKKY